MGSSKARNTVHLDLHHFSDMYSSLGTERIGIKYIHIFCDLITLKLCCERSKALQGYLATMCVFLKYYVTAYRGCTFTCCILCVPSFGLLLLVFSNLLRYVQLDYGYT